MTQTTKEEIEQWYDKWHKAHCNQPTNQVAALNKSIVDLLVDFASQFQQSPQEKGAEEFVKEYLSLLKTDMDKLEQITFTLSAKNLSEMLTEYAATRKAPQGEKGWEKLTVKIEGPFQVGETEHEYMAMIEEMRGIVVTGSTAEEAFNELLISLKVKMIYDNKLNVGLAERSATQYGHKTAGMNVVKGYEEHFGDKDKNLIYQRNEYNQQIERMIKLGLNVEACMFEQCVNAILNMAEKSVAVQSNNNQTT